jgi:CheY-like chemotaxis protein
VVKALCGVSDLVVFDRLVHHTQAQRRAAESPPHARELEAFAVPAQPLVLVCDDDAHIRYLVATKLRAAGLEVLEGRDGQEGLELALKRSPDLVLTDFQMPRMTGLQLCEALKKNSSTSGVRCVMLTARGYTITAEQLSVTNIVQIIDKPFGVRQLMERVSVLLNLGEQSKAA